MELNKGQTLLELIVVVTVGIVIVAALTFIIIFSLRNADLAKNQTQATKLAQEGAEKVRSIRDTDGGVTFVAATKFSDLWAITLSSSCSPCYFNLAGNVLIETVGNFDTSPDSNFEKAGAFYRTVILEDIPATSDKEKKVTVRVKWIDFAGHHESKVTTVLRNQQI